LCWEALARGAILIAGALVCRPLEAADTPPEDYAVHGQVTYTEQETSDFRSPYAGPNSLRPDRGAETVDVTLFLGKSVWKGGEIWLSPELDQGVGLDDTLGVAGFPSGEAYKIGKNKPYGRLQRVFLRQSFDFAGEAQTVEPQLFQLGGQQSVNRLVLTVGKFSVTDVFDNNQYAHDPRNDFLNWAAIDAGTFDYAADSWGYTVGAAAEGYLGPWALRFGIFDLSDIPNSPDLEPAFDEFQNVFEVERDYGVAGAPGKLRITGFESRGRMGVLDQAIALAESSHAPVDIALVRRYRTRLGIAMNLEQQVVDDLGVFVRVGKAEGNVEPYEFTDIDRSVSAGISLEGARWRRSEDTFGLAAIRDGISAQREQYLNAGGLGVLIGDGRLARPGAEKILESYYSLAILHAAHVSFDYQYIVNPAYNRDRGPVSVYAIRVHAQF
jgi:high affinity Mn2+ porin